LNALARGECSRLRQRIIPMDLILIILVVVLLFGGGGYGVAVVAIGENHNDRLSKP
jgi:hypothetical protein